MTEPLLRVEGLSRSFGGIEANDDISLAIERGACHGIIGPNGSGKTTLFNLVTGYHRPDAGRVWFDGEDITGERTDRIARRGLVRTFQLTAPFENLTVRRNLLAVHGGGGRPSVRVASEKVDRAERVMELLELDHVADHAASEVSGGQQKLLELGRTLMLEPSCILLDEPTAGVNPAIQRRLLRYLREINERGTTLVVIEHDMNVVGALTDRTTVLDRGRVIAQGPFDAVTADPRVRAAYIGRGSGSSAGGEPTGSTDGDRAVVRGSARSRSAAIGTARPPDDGEVPAIGADLAQGDSGPPRLVAEELVTGYGSQTVLDGVSVRSHDGVTCVFGPNGSGKSTLLKALAGVLPVWSGAIEYGDETLTSLDAHGVVRAGVSAVPQGKELFGALTVRENLQLGATTVDDPAVVRERLGTVWDTFPALDDSRSAAARSLSGGQQVMLGFARAMMAGAEVYLLDEPVSGLAPAAVDEVFEVVRTLMGRGAQVVLVEQQVREALAVADHVYLLAGGSIRFDGRPSELADEDELMSLYLGID